jgi:putative ABC transport system substrate-binding protein
MVIPGAADPVGLGIVDSLAKPGGNITGFTFLELSQFGKAIEILKGDCADGSSRCDDL